LVANKKDFLLEMDYFHAAEKKTKTKKTRCLLEDDLPTDDINRR